MNLSPLLHDPADTAVCFEGKLQRDDEAVYQILLRFSNVSAIFSSNNLVA